MNKNKGFTLIELLVVMAVIGIISSVLYAYFANARQRSNDASVKAALNQARTQAELFYSTGGTYSGVCSTASDSLNPRGINAMLYAAGKVNGYTAIVNVNGATFSPVRCNMAANGWAAQVPLKSQSGYYYCVDYTRKGIVTTVSIDDGNAFCS